MVMGVRSGFDTGYASKSSDSTEQAATRSRTIDAIAMLSFLMVLSCRFTCREIDCRVLGFCRHF